MPPGEPSTSYHGPACDLSSPPALSGTRWRRALVLGACAVLLFARRPDALLNAQFWAEDGVVFFHDAHTQGWSSLLAPYAGYFHSLPRLVAAIASHFDAAWAPTIYSAAAFLLTLYAAALTQASRCPLPPTPFVALAVVLVPDAFEVLMFLVNIQWILTPALALILLSRDPVRSWQFAHDVMATLLLGLTGPASVLFAPLFVWRAWTRRTRASAVIGLVAVIAGGVQAFEVLRCVDTSLREPIPVCAALAVPGMRVGVSLLLGTVFRFDAATAVKVGLTVLTAAGLVFLGFRRGSARQERIMLLLGGGALLIVSLFRCRGVLPDLCNAGCGSRYFVPLQIIALWLVATLLTDRRPRVSVTALVLLLWSIGINVPRLRETPLADMNWARYSRQIDSGEATKVEINPGWTFSIQGRAPKTDLTSARSDGSPRDPG